MDWSYVYMAIDQGMLGLLLLLLPVPLLAYAASPKRKIAASCPGIVGTALFLVCALVAGTTIYPAPWYLSGLTLLSPLAMLFLIPFSIFALRDQRVGLIHLITAAGTFLTLFVASMAISHDWL